MQDSFFTRVTRLGFGLSFTASSLFLAFGLWQESFGVLVSALWAFLDLYFLFQLMKKSEHPRPNPRGRVLVLTVLKFPVLYMAGFYILKSRFFSLYGILTGLTLFFAAFGIVWLRSRNAEKFTEKGIA